MMNRTRIVALGVFIIGLSASLFVLSLEPTETISAVNGLETETSRSGGNFDFKKNIPVVGNKPVNAASSDELPRSTNLTENFTDNYLSALYKENSEVWSGEKDPSRLVALDESKIESLMAEKPATTIFLPALTKQDIRIAANDSLTAQKNYVVTLDKLTKTHFRDFNDGLVSMIDEWFVTGDTKKLISYTSRLAPYISDLLKIETPQSWQEFQLGHTELWRKKLAIVSAIAEYESDPLKAYVALQYVSGVIQESVDYEAWYLDELRELAVLAKNS